MPRSLVRPALALCALIACHDSANTLAPRLASRPAFSISDAANNDGNAHFYFLPPLTPAPTFSGQFDNALSPVVTICAWNAGACAASIAAEFTMTSGPGSETVRVDADAEQYIVNWHMDQFNLDPPSTYRIRVLVAGTELGHADIGLASTGKELKNVNTGEFVPLLNGRTLPIKFRIEKGAVFVLGPEGGALIVADGLLRLDVPTGALRRAVGITVRSVHAAAAGATVAGPLYEFGPDGTQFEKPALISIRYDPIALPTGVRPADLWIGRAENGEWLQLGTPHEHDTSNDHVRGVITAPLDHFSPPLGVVATLASSEAIQLRRPWQDGQYWVPQTWPEHVPFYGAADFYYATDQQPGSFGGESNLSGSGTVGKPVFATHSGRVRVRINVLRSACTVPWVLAAGRSNNFSYVDVLVTGNVNGNSITTDYIHIRPKDGIDGTEVIAGQEIGQVADPTLSSDQWSSELRDPNGNPVSIVGCGQSKHFMVRVLRGGQPLYMDRADHISLGGEVIFAPPVCYRPWTATCSTSGEIETYSAMPRVAVPPPPPPPPPPDTREVTTLAAASLPFKMYSYGTDVFWVEWGGCTPNCGRIRKVAKQGGDVTTLVDGIIYADDFVIAQNGFLYFSDVRDLTNLTRVIKRAPITGGSSTLVMGAGDRSPAVLGGYVYALSGNNYSTSTTALVRAPLNATDVTPEVIATGFNAGGVLRSFAGALYIADPGPCFNGCRAGAGRIVRVDPETGTVTTLISGLNYPHTISFGGGDLFFAEGYAEGARTRIGRVTLSNGALTVIAEDDASGVVSDGRYVYYVGVGPVIRVDTQTGNRVVFDSGNGAYSALALDENALYWGAWYPVGGIWRAVPR